MQTSYLVDEIIVDPGFVGWDLKLTYFAVQLKKKNTRLRILNYIIAQIFTLRDKGVIKNCTFKK